MDDQAASLAGRELGGYRLLHQLGAGGGGVVYLAQRLDQPAALFALKVLDPSAITDPRVRATLRARFTREAEAVQRLRHPHILPVLAFGEQDGLLYMALPFMPGGDLAKRIGAFPRGMPLDAVASDLAQLAAALDEAHRHQVIHRDIKPTNILLDPQGQLILADFGIARLLAEEGVTAGAGGAPLTLTATGQALGTPQYMAPEQVSGLAVGPAADIYALGVVLYQMVAGTPPFVAETPIAVALKQVQEAPPPLRPQRADLPAAAEAAILRALAKRPEERFTSAGALAQAFSAGLRQPAAAAAPSTTPPTLATQAPAPTLMAPPAQPLYGSLGAPPATWNSASSRTQADQPRSSRTSGAGWAIAVAITLLAIVLAGVGYGAITNLTKGSATGSTPPVSTSASNSLSTATAGSATQWASPLVPAGPLVYETHAGGSCDQQGATWSSNGMATQSCQGNALIMSAQECNCAIGVTTLASLPAAYPSSYVAQVRVQIMGGASTAKFGFKFRQQSTQDQGQGRGGYSFLVDPNGQWQFNRYDTDGTRHILVQGQLPSSVTGAHTLDVAVSGASYSFYMDGRLIEQAQDATYSSGFLCLAIEPGATIGFSDFALFSSN